MVRVITIIKSLFFLIGLNSLIYAVPIDSTHTNLPISSNMAEVNISPRGFVLYAGMTNTYTDTASDGTYVHAQTPRICPSNMTPKLIASISETEAETQGGCSLKQISVYASDAPTIASSGGNQYYIWSIGVSVLYHLPCITPKRGAKISYAVMCITTSTW